jgi:hypothetical protein
VNVGDRFERVADRWHGKALDERGFYAFNDLHAMMSFAATGRAADSSRLLAEMRGTAESGVGANRMMTRDIGLPLAEGVLDFAQDQPDRAIERIDAVRDTANGFGGSHAQRDLLTLTLITAALRAGDFARARHLLAERQVHKPTAWSARLAARIERAALPAAA